MTQVHAVTRQDDNARFKHLVEAVEDYAIFLLDPEGIVSSWNAGAEKIKGYRADEIIGQSFTRFYPEQALASGWPQAELKQARALGRFEDEGWRLRKDGSRFWANVVITALRNPQGEVIGFAKVTRDLSERRRHEEELRQSEERFRLMVESVRDYAIYMLDPQGRVQSWNAGAQAIKGYSADEVIGRHFSMFYTHEDAQAGRPGRNLSNALRHGHLHDEGWRVRKDGSVFWAAVTITPVYDADHHLRGFAKVTHDMSERRRNAELESATRRVSEFLAMLAHELRNPLAPIRNAVGILQLQQDLPPRAAQCRDIIDRQLSHLTRLVDDLLDVGRIATGKIHLEHEPLSFRDVVLRSVEAARPLLEQRRHSLQVRLPEGPIPMTGDSTRLAQVLQNLLTNAARYTPDGGNIELAVQQEGDIVATSVTDTGQGIEPDALERIFELFIQEESAQSAAQGGLGIGLTLSRTIVELHGGSIRAESAGRGQGSRFTVRLPAGELRREEPTAAPEAQAARTAHGRRVLVVDDNRDSADTMAALLQVLGHDAQAAYDGDSALRGAARSHPEFVLLDLNMPGGSGFEVMQRLRGLPGMAATRFVAMTGHGLETDRLSTLEAGFDAHLTKPVTVDGLRELLEPRAPH